MIKNKQYLIFQANKLLVKNEGKLVKIPGEDDLLNLGIRSDTLEFLISKGDFDYFFGEVPEATNANSQYRFSELRPLIGAIDKSMFNLASKAYHLINWSNTYKYCSRCGSLVKDKEDERAKICSNCGFISYPRISPAIITAVIRDNQLLLAHNVKFAGNIHSVIAGFIDPGETFEDCVSREVFEETGIKVKNIKYFGSQPWPFPDSLMVAFTCQYESGEIKVDGVEIDRADWYGVENLPNIPLKGSIARNLIDWFISNYK